MLLSTVASNLPAFDTRLVLTRLGWVIAFALTVGFLLPALAAAYSHVFFHIDCSVVLKDHNCPPLHARPFYTNIVGYFWPIMYTCLGIIIIIAHPPGQDLWYVWSTSRGTIIVTAIATYVIDVALLWVRVRFAARTDLGRTVVAYANPDVSGPSFAAQNINFVIFAALLAILWVQWLSFGAARHNELLREETGTADIDGVININTIARLSIAMFHWQIVSAIISGAFVLYTAIFWTQLIVNKDYRYGHEVVTTYVILMITLTCITIPLAIT